MNYAIIYDALIERARQRNWKHRRFHKQGVSPLTYVEAHHIIPKNEGGDNNDYNVVILTQREHFIAHRLLTKLRPTRKNFSALGAFLARRGGHELTEVQVRVARKGTSIGRSGELSPEALIKHHKVHLGARRSLATRAKISSKAMGRKAWNAGKKMSEEQRKAMKKPKTITTVTCPHCGLVGARHNMSRYHFDNCKSI